MTLGQPDSAGVRNQGTMIKSWKLQAQSLIKQELSGGRFEQVLASNNFADLHGGIIDNHGELVRGHIVMPPDNKIAEIRAGHKLLRTVITVDERDCFGVGSEPPVDVG